VKSFDRSYRLALKTTESPTVTGPLKDIYWDKPVSELCELRDPWISTPQWQERHRIYASLLMALIVYYWNGYKYGRPQAQGGYPLNGESTSDSSPYCEGNYYGHNIAALAVDRFGYILDFDFNHNDLFNSSAEHAEARLVRRLYSHAQISDSWGVVAERTSARTERAWRGRERRRRAAESLSNEPAIADKDQSPKGATEDDVRHASLAGVTVYTSLESCAQCAGVMALAAIQQVVYLQTDPQFFFVGRILRNLTTERGRAPLPISGSEIALPGFAELDREFGRFAGTQDAKEGEPFAYQKGHIPRWSSSVTSFLCTAGARGIFERGAATMIAPLKFGAFDGTDQADKSFVDRRPLTNEEVQIEATDFLDYARRKGLRGTPHNL